MKNKSKKNFKKGFGLLEVLISAVIVIMILSALVMLGRTAMRNTDASLARTQAVFLAQEALEQVRQMRDSNWIDGKVTSSGGIVYPTNWDSWVFSSGFSAPLSSLDYYVNPSLPFSFIRTAPLSNKDYVRPGLTSAVATQNIDNYSGVTGTSFTTKIKVSGVGEVLPANGLPNTDVQKAANAYKVTAEVTWIQSGVGKKISASEILTNWRPQY